MFKYAVPVLAALLAMPAAAQVTVLQGATTAPEQGDPNRQICERITKTGSRLATMTVCRTAREWEQLRQGHRHDLEKVQQVINMPPSNPGE